MDFLEVQIERAWTHTNWLREWEREKWKVERQLQCTVHCNKKRQINKDESAFKLRYGWSFIYNSATCCTCYGNNAYALLNTAVPSSCLATIRRPGGDNEYHLLFGTHELSVKTIRTFQCIILSVIKCTYRTLFIYLWIHLIAAHKAQPKPCKCCYKL